jgi:hypothetical protein
MVRGVDLLGSVINHPVWSSMQTLCFFSASLGLSKWWRASEEEGGKTVMNTGRVLRSNINCSKAPETLNFVCFDQDSSTE